MNEYCVAAFFTCRRQLEPEFIHIDVTDYFYGEGRVHHIRIRVEPPQQFAPDRLLALLCCAIFEPDVRDEIFAAGKRNLFLPPGFGPSGGQFIAVGRTKATATGQITAYDSAGNATGP